MVRRQRAGAKLLKKINSKKMQIVLSLFQNKDSLKLLNQHFAYLAATIAVSILIIKVI